MQVGPSQLRTKVKSLLADEVADRVGDRQQQRLGRRASGACIASAVRAGRRHRPSAVSIAQRRGLDLPIGLVTLEELVERRQFAQTPADRAACRHDRGRTRGTIRAARAPWTPRHSSARGPRRRRETAPPRSAGSGVSLFQPRDAGRRPPLSHSISPPPRCGDAVEKIEGEIVADEKGRGRAGRPSMLSRCARTKCPDRSPISNLKFSPLQVINYRITLITLIERLRSDSRRVRPLPKEITMTLTYRTASVDGLKVFYREAGDANAPTVLLLHGFPTSSHMYRELIPALADRYHVVAPDLPGFGFTRCAGSSGLQIYLRPSGRRDRALHRGPRSQPLRPLRLRLRRTGRFPPRRPSPRADHRADLAERQCVCRGAERGLEPDPGLLEGSFRPKTAPLCAPS